MFDRQKRFAAVALPLLLGLGAAGVAVGADQSGSTSGPTRCDIEATSFDGMIALQGIVSADMAISGSYSFKVAGRGTDIEQGGGFSAGPGGESMLGQVMLGGSAVYDASLSVTANGKTIKCARRVGGAI